jgi:hypothetical protein
VADGDRRKAGMADILRSILSWSMVGSLGATTWEQTATPESKKVATTE